MNKSLIVFNNNLPKGADIEEVVKYFGRRGIVSHSVDCVNWKEYPYRPRVTMRIAHNRNEIFLQFRVVERGVRGTFAYDFGSRPWTDSCVEFFMIPDQAKGDYYNIEINCIGHGTFACGPDRNTRHNFDDSVIRRIRRVSTLGSQPLVIEGGRRCWALTMAIPFDIYGLDGNSISGRTFKANFYKCGDDMPVPHFLSWNPIGCPTPNFHAPEYFGDITFE